MNFLAHFLLSAGEEDLRLGNLLGDFVKGRVERYAHPGVTPRMRTGIRLHRAIDSFSDGHHVVRRTKQRIAHRYGRLSGVIVDVYYDHVLAREWPRHGEGDLQAFARDVYRTLQGNLPRLPGEIHPLVQAMTRGDWLSGYADIAYVERALRGMARRSAVARDIGTAGEELAAHYPSIADDFAEFFPDLRAHCATFLADRLDDQGGSP
ncbi:ACP phosphodiesterase [Luteitalea sp. TBR-22]|uniref:acyl carrier protein phosphodiesterase n=1 Tax=Luteitalea sp. TBR-22 TaxID=2802971 RepID=UPI001AF40DB6|nr:ACP phosphodiesterase [Luteitalea sp. TBR-22]BCS32092.1 ACP phosphodiesterase [Luteitalea sp. TBR-22]